MSEPADDNPGDKITIDDIADSFAARLGRGERPSIAEYKKKYPQLADQIEAVFPALVMLENVESYPPARRLAVDDSIPLVLGEYEIIQEVGRGGMGIVFEAQHTTMRRRVALKVLPKSAAEKPGYLSRFLTEARSAGQLHHTNIVPVFEVGEADGIQFYAMQFITGENLDRVIEDIKQLRNQSGPLREEEDSPTKTQKMRVTNGLSETIARGLVASSQGGIGLSESRPNRTSQQELASLTNTTAIESHAETPKTEWISHSTESTVGPASNESSIFSDSVFGNTESSVAKSRGAYHHRVAAVIIQAAEALDHAHHHGVLHRDIKPANLILDTEGNIWVTDFGLAKIETDDLTQTGDIIGTLRYMAPERFDGEADCRSDIFSLGLTLYELCTLQCGIDSDRSQLIKDVPSRSVVLPRKIDDTIPADLETIILKSIEAQPERRYQTAKEFAEDLSLFLADRPINARRASIPERCWRVCRRNPLTALLVGCIATLLVALAVGSLQFAYYSARQTASEISARKESQRNLYLSKVDQAQMRRFSRRIGQRFESLNAIREAVELLPELELDGIELKAAKLALRNEAIAALALLDMRKTSELPLEAGWGLRLRVAFSRNYDVFAEGHADGRIRVKFVKDLRRKPIVLPSPGLGCSKIKLSSDARYLASIHHPENGLYRDVMLNVWDLENTAKPLFTTTYVTGFDFSGDSKSLGFAEANTVKVVSLISGEIVSSTIPGFAPRLVNISNDGSQIVTSERGGIGIELWTMGNKPTLNWSAEPGTFNITAMDWRDEDSLLAVGNVSGEVYFWRGSLEREATRLDVHQSEVKRLHIHPIKDLIASDTMEADIRLTTLIADKEPLRVDRIASLLYTGFSSEGNLCYFDQAKKLIGTWDVAQPLLQNFSEAASLGRTVRFHPTKPALLARSAGSVIEFWDLEQRTLHAVFDMPGHSDFRFSKDGLSLFTSGRNGLRRWPLDFHSSKTNSSQLDLGKPVTLISGITKKIVLNQTGNLIVVEDANFGASVYKVSDGSHQVRFGTHGGLDTIAITADDRFLLTGTFYGRGVGVWDMKTGKLVKMLIEQDQNSVPTAHPTNGNRFVSVGGKLRFWEVGNLENHELVNHVEIFKSKSRFSSDGGLFAVQNRLSELRLLDPELGSSMATFETANAQRLVDFRFSADGRRLALSCFDDLQILELSKLREKLAELKLDWGTERQ